MTPHIPSIIVPMVASAMVSSIAKYPREYEITDVTVEEVYCLALNVYFESRNTSRDDKIAVAYVVLNRFSSGEKKYETLCDVVYEPKQFSWTFDGKLDLPNLKNVIERKAWEESLQVASDVYFGIVENPVVDAKFYHSVKSVPPEWANKMWRVRITDGHIFYTMNPSFPLPTPKPPTLVVMKG